MVTLIKIKLLQKWNSWSTDNNVSFIYRCICIQIIRKKKHKFKQQLAMTVIHTITGRIVSLKHMPRKIPVSPWRLNLSRPFFAGKIPYNRLALVTHVWTRGFATSVWRRQKFAYVTPCDQAITSQANHSTTWLCSPARCAYGCVYAHIHGYPRWSQIQQSQSSSFARHLHTAKRKTSMIFTYFFKIYTNKYRC